MLRYFDYSSYFILLRSCKLGRALRVGFWPDFEKNFDSNSGPNEELENKRLFLHFQVVNNNTNCAKSDEFALTGIYTFIAHFSRGSYVLLRRLQILFEVDPKINLHAWLISI